MNSFRDFWKSLDKKRITKPAGATHTVKWDRCVQHVRASNPGADPYAVCTAMLGDESFKAMDENKLNAIIDKALKNMGIVGGGPIPESKLARQDLEGESRTTKAAKGDTKWITVGGKHIPIKPGENKKDVIAEALDEEGDKEFADHANLAAKVPHIHPEDVKIMSRYIDAVSSKDDKALQGSLGDDAERLAERWGISQEKGTAGIARGFKDVFEGKKKVKPTKKNIEVLSGFSNVGNLISRIGANQKHVPTKKSSFKDAWSRVKPR